MSRGCLACPVGSRVKQKGSSFRPEAEKGHALTWGTWTGLKCSPSQFTAPWINWWRGRAMAYRTGDVWICFTVWKAIKYTGVVPLFWTWQSRLGREPPYAPRKGSFRPGLSKDFPSDSVTVTAENLLEHDIAGAYFGPRQQCPLQLAFQPVWRTYVSFCCELNRDWLGFTCKLLPLQNCLIQVLYQASIPNHCDFTFF